ncbi:MAG TPA: DUF456 domain-containing protein [Verrucomicrobiae bacterium]|nr:DUF456 domain-containing protein [Verrucomicrobiae bacterium]
MTAGEIIGLILTLLVMLVGFIGSAVPLLPGPPLVLIAAFGHRLWFGEHSASWFVLLCLTFLTAVALLLDHFSSVYGAKRFGATWRGLLGAFVGGVIGIFFNIPGIILGPFLGAMLFEMLGGYKIDKASHAGVGATLGVFAGIVGKCALSLVMIGLFTASVVLRS